MTRKILALALALLLVFPSALAEEPDLIDSAEAAETARPPEETAEENPVEIPDTLVVGNTTAMQGHFFTDLWGNATSDIDVRRLIHAYHLVHWDSLNGMFAIDPTVVTGVVGVQNADGSHTYTMALAKDMFFSNGRVITAWDYAFSLLLRLSPQCATLGASPAQADSIAGAEEYRSGKTLVLSGVRVLTMDTLSITISADILPFFYEVGLLDVLPYPIEAIAPGVVVKDDGEGVYLANEDDDIVRPLFSVDLLRKTIFDPETGYDSHPSVVSGPYTLESFDGVTCVFHINPRYKGNLDGIRPTIENIVFTLAENDTMISKLEKGEFGLVNKVLRVDAINSGISVMDRSLAEMTNYPREGLSFLGFSTRWTDERVRQAVAWCMDRDALTLDYTGSFGMRVDGYYGMGQWMFRLASGTLTYPVNPPEDPDDEEAAAEYEAAVAEWEAMTLENLTVYTVDTERAASLLDEAGWHLNALGRREMNGETLDLTLAYPAGNRIREAFEKYLMPHLEEVGVRLTLVPMEMPDLLVHWYTKDEQADLYFLATNFSLVYEPSPVFRDYNEPLYQLALDMRSTQRGDVKTYLGKWITFQEAFNASVPMIPLYSNVYFDFYSPFLQNYWVAENVAWSDAIVPAYLGLPPVEEQGETAEEQTEADEEEEEEIMTEDGEPVIIDDSI